MLVIHKNHQDGLTFLVIYVKHSVSPISFTQITPASIVRYLKIIRENTLGASHVLAGVVKENRSDYRNESGQNEQEYSVPLLVNPTHSKAMPFSFGVDSY